MSEQDARLELLVGHLSDQLQPVRELVAALRLQANASVTTRSKLESLYSMTGLLWGELCKIREEIDALRQRTE